MVNELRQAFEQTQQQLSDDAQRLLAAHIEAWLDEQEWGRHHKQRRRPGNTGTPRCGSSC